MKPTIEQYKILIEKGLTSKQIANTLGIAKSSVQRHLKKYELKTVHNIEPYIITKEQLKHLIEKNYSTYDIAKELKCSQCVIKNRLKLFELKTHAIWSIVRTKTKKEIDEGYKTCSKCHQKKYLTSENFYLKKNGKFHYWCKECNCKITSDKQKKMKIYAVDYKGGKCCLCGYSKYFGALDFHHVNPSEKEFAIGSLRAYGEEKLKYELDKCILVCKNCHAEIHGKVVDSPGLEPGNDNYELPVITF